MFNKSENKTSVDCRIINNQFSLKFPKEGLGWRETTVYTFEGPEEDGVKHNILVTIDNDVDIDDLEKYADLQISALENSLQGYTELKREEIKLEKGLPAYELVYKWCPMKSVKVYQKVIYILQNDTGYTLTATFSKRTFKIHGPVVDKILKSFEVPQV